MKKLLKVIFIDRDGVINEDNLHGYITSWSKFHFLPGVLKSLRQLSKAGFSIVIISNQAGVGDRVYSKKSLDHITKKMLGVMRKHAIAIKGVFYCLHGKKAGCNCRKPKVGLFEKAAQRFHFERPKTFLVGDKVSDVIAGKRFGLKTAFVLTGHGKNHIKKINRHSKPDLIARNLPAVVRKLLKAKG